MAIQTAASIADDYLQWENTETVSLISVKHGAANDTTVDDITAKPLALQKPDFEILGNIGIESDGRVWLLPDTLLSGEKPKPSDVIVRADATRWVILTAGNIVHETVWRCLVNLEPS